MGLDAHDLRPLDVDLAAGAPVTEERAQQSPQPAELIEQEAATGEQRAEAGAVWRPIG